MQHCFYLPLLRFRCVGGHWDRTQALLRLWHWQSCTGRHSSTPSHPNLTTPHMHTEPENDDYFVIVMIFTNSKGVTFSVLTICRLSNLSARPHPASSTSIPQTQWRSHPDLKSPTCTQSQKMMILLSWSLRTVRGLHDNAYVEIHNNWIFVGWVLR